MSTDRKLPRSQRAIIAVSLLIIAAAAVIAGVVVATVSALIAAAVVALVSGIVAARILSNEIAQQRRDWAQDRARIADEQRQLTVVRSAEQIAFANHMETMVRERDVRLAELTRSLHDIEIELAEAHLQVAKEKARCEELVADVHARHAEIDAARAELARAHEALAASQAAEVQARAEITAWEQSAADAARSLRERPGA